jgi:hypothetical protein
VTVSEHDFEAIEAKMREHVKADETFEREDVTPGAALERFVREGQDYKVELIEDLVRGNGVETVSLYTNGPFTDLCRGPHAPSTKRIKAFKLLSVAGAYWRGDASRRCSRASTARRSSPRRTSPRISSGSSRPARATTASSAASSTVPVQRALAGLAVLAAERAWSSGTR